MSWGKWLPLLAIPWMCWDATTSYLDRPVMIKSYLTGQCTSIKQPNKTTFTCENPPPKYDVAWAD